MYEEVTNFIAGTGFKNGCINKNLENKTGNDCFCNKSVVLKGFCRNSYNYKGNLPRFISTTM